MVLVQPADLGLQSIGLSSGHDGIVLRGDRAERSFSVVYLQAGASRRIGLRERDERLCAEARTRGAGARPDPAMLARSDIPLKTCR